MKTQAYNLPTVNVLICFECNPFHGPLNYHPYFGRIVKGPIYYSVNTIGNEVNILKLSKIKQLINCIIVPIFTVYL